MRSKMKSATRFRVSPSKVNMEILSSPANLPFTAALAIVLLLGALEIIGLMIGGASAISIDGAEVDAPPVDVGGDGDFDAEGILSQLLGWLHVGQIPVTILAIVWLFNFGVAGLLLQNAIQSVSGAMLPMLLASVIAFFISLPATRIAGGVLKKVLPRDETEAVSSESFLGCEARITTGMARRGRPAEARVRDRFGRTHYVMVEPENDDETFASGSPVLILKRSGDIFRVMDNQGATIEDD